MSIKCETVDDRFGYAYVSSNGQLVIDNHASDDEHLRAPASRGEQPLYDCRVYLVGLIPKEWHGQWGRLVVTRDVLDDGRVASIRISFTPTDRPTDAR